MQIQITDVTDIKTGDYGVSSKIHCGDETYFVNEDASKYKGQTVELEVTEKTSKKGNKYKVGKITGVVSGPPAVGNGAVHWTEYLAMMRLAHNAALELEPDVLQDEHVAHIDRSKARSAIVNTVMIAFANGKLTHDEMDDLPF